MQRRRPAASTRGRVAARTRGQAVVSPRPGLGNRATRSLVHARRRLAIGRPVHGDAVTQRVLATLASPGRPVVQRITTSYTSHWHNETHDRAKEDVYSRKSISRKLADRARAMGLASGSRLIANFPSKNPYYPKDKYLVIVVTWTDGGTGSSAGDSLTYITAYHSSSRGLKDPTFPTAGYWDGIKAEAY